MSFATELQGRTATVHVGAELDYRNAETFKSTCGRALDNGARVFILDFSDVRILDSSGLGAIFHLYRRTSRRDGAVLLAALSAAAETAIQVVRLTRVIPCFPTVSAAREALDV
ncbi:STAS domain-containing protein [Rhodocaloribacter sp.]